MVYRFMCHVPKDHFIHTETVRLYHQGRLLTSPLTTTRTDEHRQFIHWPVLHDDSTVVPSLVLGGVTAGHCSVAMGTGNTKEILLSTKSDTLRHLRQTWLSYTSSVKAGVRSCCLFNFLTRHRSGLSTPLVFSFALSLSLSLCLFLLHKNPFSHIPSRTFGHTYFHCLRRSTQ